MSQQHHGCRGLRVNKGIASAVPRVDNLWVDVRSGDQKKEQNPAFTSVGLIFIDEDRQLWLFKNAWSQTSGSNRHPWQLAFLWRTKYNCCRYAEAFFTAPTPLLVSLSHTLSLSFFLSSYLSFSAFLSQPTLPAVKEFLEKAKVKLP